MIQAKWELAEKWNWAPGCQ